MPDVPLERVEYGFLRVKERMLHLMAEVGVASSRQALLALAYVRKNETFFVIAPTAHDPH
ncbi:hypothetical protein ACIHFC_36330 [Streptomyces sp. NPDC052013]|uniref:hypothetical protein n=1 Tax=Streptomyces sp. NPDC052013 TaxID=3365679 RepID=UPI0037CFFE74